MEKLDKVIAGLERCVDPDCENCEYNGRKCITRLLTDTIEVLKELSGKYRAALEAAATATELAAKYRKVDGDLISRSELLGTESLLMTDIVENDPVAKFVLEQVLHDIKAAPAVAAEPVVHAHWMFYEDESGEWWDKCSHCGGKIPNSGGYPSDLPRCPECGAHMDEEVAE